MPWLWIARVGGLVPVELQVAQGQAIYGRKKMLLHQCVHIVVGSQSRKYDSVPESVLTNEALLDLLHEDAAISLSESGNF